MRPRRGRWIKAAAGLLLAGGALLALFWSFSHNVEAALMEWVLDTQADWDGYSAVKTNVVSTAGGSLELQSSSGWSSVSSNTTKNVVDIDMLSGNQGWAVANDGGNPGNSDILSWNGSAWSAQQVSSARFYAIDMVAANAGWVAGQGTNEDTLYYFNGSTWSKLFDNKAGGFLYSLSMLDANFGWAAGQGGRAVYCQNQCGNAANWSAAQPFNWVDIRDLHITSTTSGWAVGASGRIYKYGGGTTWTKLASNTSPKNPVDGQNIILYSVHAVSPTSAWAVGQSGRVLYFNGTDWEDRTSYVNKTGINMYGVRGLDTNNDGRSDEVWIVGSGGNIGRGYNCGGAPITCTWSWTTAPGFTGNLNGVFMHNAKAGWAVGNSGKVFQYGGFPASGTATYTFDAGGTVNWKAHAYGASTGPTTAVSFEWATSNDGTSWSPWSGDIAVLPNSRYLRQKITLTTTEWSETPQVQSSTVTYETDITPPAAPANLAASVGTSQTVVLSWDANSEPDLAGYNLYRSTDGSNYNKVNGALITTNGYTDTTVSNGVYYYYKARAVDTAENESADSNVVTAVPNDAAPATPTGLTATKGDGQVTLNWNENTEPDLVGYNLYRSTDGSNYTKINGAVLTDNAYTDTGLTNGTTYYYKVTAVDAGNNESAPSAAVSATPSEPDLTPPSTPTGLAATAGDGQVALSWNPSTDNVAVAGYNLYRSTDNDYYAKINSSPLAGTSYVDTNRINGRTYYYKVSAVDTSDNESALSAAVSATPGDQTPPAAPTGLQATVSDGEVRLRWNQNGEADLTGYNIYRSTDGSNYVKINASLVNTNSYTNLGVTNGATYHYRVTAVDNAGNESPPSESVSAVPGGRLFRYGPPDTKTQVTSPGGIRTVQIRFSPEDGVTYYVYKHSYGDGRSFRNVGGAVYYNNGSLQTLDPNWGLDTTPGYVYYADTDVVDYAEYYYFVRADTDPAWPVDEVTGAVYVPLQEYVVTRAFPPGQTMHGEFTEFTNACTVCHGLHSSPSGKLLKARTSTDLCASCHDGSGSKYDMVMGRVRTGADWGTYTANPAGAFGTQFKDVAGAPVMNSAHNVWRDALTADGSPSATAAQFWQAPGSTYLAAPSPDPGTWTKPLTCTGCHEPHNKYNNYRLLRGNFNAGGYVFPDDTGGVRTQVVVRGVSEINLGHPGGGQMASRYLAGSATAPTGSGITDFCTGCHRFFAGPYNEKLPTFDAGIDYHGREWDNVHDYDPTGTNSDNDSLDNPGTHGWKRHMMSMPANYALLFGGDRIVDPGRTGVTGNQARLIDWNGSNGPKYIPLEGMHADDGEATNGNEYALNKVVCLTCHVPHGSPRAAGGIGPDGEVLDLENAYRNNKLNNTDDMPAGDGYEEDPATGYEKGRHPVSGYLHNRNNGLIYGSSSVLARFEPFASACWRCHSTK